MKNEMQKRSIGRPFSFDLRNGCPKERKHRHHWCCEKMLEGLALLLDQPDVLRCGLPKVLNARLSGKHPHENAVYIGRPSVWGNPFQVGRDGTRDEVIARYIDHMRARPDLLRKARLELAGKDLVCWCAPKACHGDVLLAIAAGDPLPAPKEPDQFAFTF